MIGELRSDALLQKHLALRAGVGGRHGERAPLFPALEQKLGVLDDHRGAARYVVAALWALTTFINLRFRMENGGRTI